MDGTYPWLAGKGREITHITAGGVSFVSQPGYKQAFHLVKIEILALMVVPLIQVPENT